MNKSEVELLKDRLQTVTYQLNSLKDIYYGLRSLTDSSLIVDGVTFLNQELDSVSNGTDSVIKEIRDIVIPTLNSK